LTVTTAEAELVRGLLRDLGISPADLALAASACTNWPHCGIGCALSLALPNGCRPGSALTVGTSAAFRHLMLSVPVASIVSRRRLRL
jgi:hypothetical protein